MVAFSKKGEILVGEVAKRQAITNPDRTIRSIKREMGTDHKIDIDGKSWTPQEISARILMKLKTDAESYLGDKVTEAVITVPGLLRRRAAAGHQGGRADRRSRGAPHRERADRGRAGLRPRQGRDGDQTILVFDLGGGTFDVSLLDLGEGVFEVSATHGDSHLGGDDWDQRVIDHLVKTFKNEHGIDLSQDKMAVQRLKEAAEKAKMELSSTQQTTINLPFITAGEHGPLHLESTLYAFRVRAHDRGPPRSLQGPVRASGQGREHRRVATSTT